MVATSIKQAQTFTSVVQMFVISETARRTLAPGVTWWGWRVPSVIEAGIVLALGLAMLAVAIFEFTRTE
jgi:ABC-2 type transport system permease protein